MKKVLIIGATGSLAQYVNRSSKTFGKYRSYTVYEKYIADFVSKLINYPNLYINENLGISKPA
jgi:hypothetical protein